MTVTNTTVRWMYDGDGASTAFVYDNRIFAATDLQVYVDGSLKTNGVDYTVTGVGVATGGTIVFTTAPATGTQNVLLVRAAPALQTATWAESQRLISQQQENAIDSLTLLAQQGQAEAQRAMRLAPTSAYTGSLYLPDPAPRRALVWNEAGDALTTSEVEVDNLTSEQVSYLPAGTGAVSRTVRAKLRETVSVADFGAVGDGVTDDTAAFLAAIDYAASLGGAAIHVPAGVYIASIDLTSRVNVAGSSALTGVSLIGQRYGSWGAGNPATTIKGLPGLPALDINITATYSGAPVAGLDYFRPSCASFEDIFFRAGGGATVAAVRNVRTAVTFRRCQFGASTTAGALHGFYGLNCQYTQFFDCSFIEAIGQSTSAGCYIGSSYGETAANEIIFQSCNFGSSHNGLWVAGALNMVIAHARFQEIFNGGTAALVIAPFLDGPASETIAAENCYFEFNRIRDIYINPSVLAAKIRGCIFQGLNGGGGHYSEKVASIELLSGLGCSIENCNFRTASAPTININVDGASFVYLGNDKPPSSFALAGNNAGAIIHSPPPYGGAALATLDFYGTALRASGSDNHRYEPIHSKATTHSVFTGEIDYTFEVDGIHMPTATPGAYLVSFQTSIFTLLDSWTINTTGVLYVSWDGASMNTQYIELTNHSRNCSWITYTVTCPNQFTVRYVGNLANGGGSISTWTGRLSVSRIS